MKYYCKANKKIKLTKEETIKTMYPRIKIVDSLAEITNNLSQGDIVIFEDVLDLDKTEENNIANIVEIYSKLVDYGIELMFVRSSTCDSEIIFQTVFEFKEKGLVFKSDKVAFEALLELQIKSYINYKDSNANLKKFAQLSASKNEGKTYGRPVGSKRDSAKAAKAKEFIKTNSVDFEGDKSDEDCMSLTGLARTTFYRYKKQLKEELNEDVQ